MAKIVVQLTIEIDAPRASDVTLNLPFITDSLADASDEIADSTCYTKGEFAVTAWMEDS